MTKGRIEFQKSSKAYLFLGIGISIVFIPALCLQLPFFEPDDYLMSYIANGSLGSEIYNLIYPNIVFGIILRPLYLFLPTLNWYGIALLGTQAVSIGAAGQQHLLFTGKNI